MIRFKQKVLRLGLLSCVGLAVLVAGCATSGPPENVRQVSCTAANVQWDVTPDVQLLDFGCTLGKHGMDPALIYTMTLKNVTDKPLRYRVNIFLLDMDKAAGHLVPRKGKPPVVKPGESAKVKIPFIKTSEMASKIQVIVRSMQ